MAKTTIFRWASWSRLSNIISPPSVRSTKVELLLSGLCRTSHLKLCLSLDLPAPQLLVSVGSSMRNNSGLISSWLEPGWCLHWSPHGSPDYSKNTSHQYELYFTSTFAWELIFHIKITHSIRPQGHHPVGKDLQFLDNTYLKVQGSSPLVNLKK